MPTTSNDDYMDTPAMAAYVKVSEAKLRKDRLMKRGFPYTRMGRKVLYRRSDADRALADNLVSHSA